MTQPGAPRSDTTKFHRRWMLPLLLLVGAVVLLPALRCGYLLDDYLHLAMAHGKYPVHRSPFDLYNFVNEADRVALAARGMLPWWSDPNLSVRFFRPLSSALIWAEHRFLGDSPAALHGLSLLWWGAAVVASRALFRRLLPQRPARIATVIFALAPCHALPVAWLANREALVSLAFGTAGLNAYERSREERSALQGVLAAILFALSMLAGEYAFCFTGYVLAREIVLARHPPAAQGGTSVSQRTMAAAAGPMLLGVLPFAAPATALLLVRRGLGYGTRASGFYVDPFREPLAFLSLAPRRIATLMLDGWFSLDHHTIVPVTPWWVLAPALVVGLAVVAPPLARTLGGLDPPLRRTMTWLLLGSLLASLPVLAVVPSPRLLGVSLLGIAATVAMFLDRVWFADREPPSETAGRTPIVWRNEHTTAAAVVLGFVHLVHGPGTSFLVGRHFSEEAEHFGRRAAQLRARIDDPTSAELMVLRGYAASLYVPFALDPGKEPPARWRMLAWTGHVLARRMDARTLELVVPLGDALFPLDASNLFRNDRTRIAVGDVFTLPGMRVAVLDVGPAGPRRARFTFDRDVDDPSLRWLTENRDYTLPDAVPPKEGFGKPFDP